jgi:osmotically-inducible protein OsmY
MGTIKSRAGKHSRRGARVGRDSGRASSGRMARVATGKHATASKAGSAGTRVTTDTEAVDPSATVRQIERNIRADRALKGSDITVKFARGKVTLAGTAPSLKARRAATGDVCGLRGVRKIENTIRIVHPRGRGAGDREISAGIKNAYFESSDVDSSEVGVRVSRGRAILDGEVDSYWNKMQAEDIASGIDGVRHVENNIEVKPLQVTADEYILEEIEQAFEANPHISSDDIRVTVEEGVVTLSGTVETWGAFNDAQEIASHVAGVVEVVNDLVIGEMEDTAWYWKQI